MDMIHADRQKDRNNLSIINVCEIIKAFMVNIWIKILSGESVCHQNIGFLINFDAAHHPREF
jgi:hypothetical protein